jgi:hypothetical protein
MGVNKINVAGTGTGAVAVEFYLYYLFGNSRNDITFVSGSIPDLTTFLANPSPA